MTLNELSFMWPVEIFDILLKTFSQPVHCSGCNGCDKYKVWWWGKGGGVRCHNHPHHHNHQHHRDQFPPPPPVQQFAQSEKAVVHEILFLFRASLKAVVWKQRWFWPQPCFVFSSHSPL